MSAEIGGGGKGENKEQDPPVQSSYAWREPRIPAGLLHSFLACDTLIQFSSSYFGKYEFPTAAVISYPNSLA
jgi:hypothetical protein